MLGLYCCEAFSLVDMHKLLTVVASGCQAQALGTRASGVVTCGLRSCGSVVVVHELSCPWHVGSSQIRGPTCDSCIGRQTLYH